RPAGPSLGGARRLPWVALQGVLRVGRGLVYQLLTAGHAERARHSDVVQGALAVEEPEQQRADHAAALVPTEPGHHAVARALVLDLHHRALVLAVGLARLLDDHTVESCALEAVEPVGRRGRIGRDRRQVD